MVSDDNKSGLCAECNKGPEKDALYQKWLPQN
jgi:hypothetical protein